MYSGAVSYSICDKVMKFTSQVNKEERPYIVVMTRALIHIVLNRIGGIEDMPAVHLAEMLIGMGCMGLRDSKVSSSASQDFVNHPECTAECLGCLQQRG